MEQQPHENKNMQTENAAEQQTPANAGMEHSPTHDTPTADASGGSEEEQSGPVGPIVGAIIVIAILVFGGLYFWGAHLNNTQQEEVPLILEDESSAQAQYDGALGPEPGTSDEIGAIEDDAENINMAQFEAEMEAELQALEEELESM